MSPGPSKAKPMRNPVAAMAAALLLGGSASPAAAAEEPRFTAAELKADLDFAAETITRSHPQVEHSVDRAALDRAVADVARRLDQPMDSAQAWAALARLNPVLADGHLLIGPAGWRA